MRSYMLFASVVAVLANVNQVIQARKLSVNLEAYGVNYDLCDRAGGFGEVSSIQRLISGFAVSDEPHYKQWIRPLRDLQDVCGASLRDACSMETIERIEQFHRSYVIVSSTKSRKKAPKVVIPEEIKLFFMHFAEQTLEKCQSELNSRLHEATSSSADLAKMRLLDSYGGILDTMSQALVPRSRVKRFDDFLLVFNSVNYMEKKNFLPVKMQNPSKGQEVQRICEQNLRPVYYNTVLPIMKLIDLGYGKSLDIGQSELIPIWYESTQLCQLVESMKFISSKDLEASQLEEETEVSKEAKEMAKKRVAIDLTPVRLIDNVKRVNDDTIIERVKASYKARSELYHNMVKNLL